LILSEEHTWRNFMHRFINRLIKYSVLELRDRILNQAQKEYKCPRF
jgi:hypothetical protein